LFANALELVDATADTIKGRLQLLAIYGGPFECGSGFAEP
jgi:hypothetical protein